MSPPDALVFVYNAEPGIVAGIMDSIHKTLSPDTYPCSLCGITYGAVSMRPEWRQWLKAQPWDAVFTYRDDFRAQHPSLAQVPLSAIFRNDEGRLSLLVSAEEMAAAHDVAALIALIERALGGNGPAR